jgi:hypothetical protein
VTGRQDLHQLDILHQILDTHSLVDSYRQKHPHNIETTHTNIPHSRAARLNRIYTPASHHTTHSKNLSETLKCTDHKTVIATIDTMETHSQLKQSPHWKFNNTLLYNKNFVEEITKLIQTFTENTPTEDIQQHWEILKNTIRIRSQILSAQMHKHRTQQEKILEEAIRLLKQEDSTTTNIHTLQTELEKFKQHTFQGTLLRTRLRTITQETPTKQYLAIEQNVQRNRQISQIVDLHGTIQTDTQKVAHAFEEYYKNLYTEEPVKSDIQDDFLQYARKLPDTDKEALDTALTLTDITQAVNTMQKDKSPGPDGLTT